MNSINPCKDCEVRFLGCHQNCEDYIDWKRTSDIIRKQRNKKRNTERELNEIRSKSIEKARK